MMKLDYFIMGRSILGIRINQSKYALLVNTLNDASESMKDSAIDWVARVGEVSINQIFSNSPSMFWFLEY
jgi:hypothetical protein